MRRPWAAGAIPAILLLGPALWSGPAAAALPGDETPGPVWIEAIVTIDLSSLPTIAVTSVSAVRELQAAGQNLTARDLRALRGVDPGLEPGLLAAVDQSFNDSAGRFLPGIGTIENSTRTPGRVTAWGTDASTSFEEPVEVTTSGTYLLLPSTFGLAPGADLGGAVQGILTLGARITRSVSFSADPGTQVRYIVVPPASAGVHDGAALRTDGRWTLDNRAGAAPLILTANLTLAGWSPNPPIAEDISIDAVVDLSSFSSAQLSIDVSVRSVDVDRAAALVPPEVDGLRFVSADGVRLAVATGLTSWTELELLIVEPELEALEAHLGSLTGAAVRVDFSWEASSLTGYDPATMAGPPVRGRAWANLTGGTLGGVDEELARAVLDAGGGASIDLLPDTDAPATTTLVLPANTTMTDTIGVTGVAADGRTTVRFAPTGGFRGTLRGLRPGYGANDSRVSVNLYVQDTTPDLAVLLVRGTADIPVRVHVVATINHIEVPENLRSALPQGLSLAYVDAHLIRLLLREGIINRSDLAAYLETFRPALSGALTAALGSNVSIRLLFEEATLEPNATGAIRILALGSGTRTKDIRSVRSVGGAGPAGPAERVIEVRQLFSFQGRSGWDVEYRVFFPASVEVVRASGERPVRVESSHRSVRVAFGHDGGWNNVTVTVRPTLEATLAKTLPQWPCFGSILLLLVVVFLVRRHRLRRRRLRRVARDGPGPVRPVRRAVIDRGSRGPVARGIRGSRDSAPSRRQAARPGSSRRPR